MSKTVRKTISKSKVADKSTKNKSTRKDDVPDDSCSFTMLLNKKSITAYRARLDPWKVGLYLPDEESQGNPRIWSLMEQVNQEQEITEDAFMELMKTHPRFKKLRDSIDSLKQGLLETGETTDPIVVWRGLAVEGNRRVIAYRALNEDGAEGFDSIPALVIPDELDEEDILSFLAQVHVNSKSKWRSIDRAALAAKLRDEKGWTAERIARHLGWTDKMISIYLGAHDLMRRYQQETGDLNHDNFSKFYKAMGNSLLMAQMLDKSSETYNAALWAWFRDLIFNGQINNCRHVAENMGSGNKDILSCPKSREIATQSGTQAAIDWLIRHDGDRTLLEIVDQVQQHARENQYMFAGSTTAAQDNRHALQRVIIDLQKFLDKVSPLALV